MAITTQAPAVDTSNRVWAASWTYTFAPFALADTSTHDATTDTTLPLLDLRQFPGEKVVFVTNGTNQSISFVLVSSPNGTTLYPLEAAKTLTTTQAATYDGTSYPELDHPYPWLGVRLSASVAPTTGTITITVFATAV